MMTNRISKPKMKWLEVDRYMEGEETADPVLVVNSIEAPTLHIDVRCLAAKREVHSVISHYETIVYIIEGEGRNVQERDGEVKTYPLGTDDLLFISYGVASTIVNDGKRPLKYVWCQGISLNGLGIPERAKELYGVPYATSEIEFKDVRLLKSGQRETYTHGHRARTPVVYGLQRGIQYPNCGSRTVAGSRSKRPAGLKQTPHWQNFDEIRYIIRGDLIDHQGPFGHEEVEIRAESGDLLYMPSRVRHYQYSPTGCDNVTFWGITLVPWCPDMEDGKYGNYNPNSLIYREGD